jgi:hypothetical protein
VRVDTKEDLADSDENCDVQNQIQRQLPGLNVVQKQEASKKFVGWKRQPTEHKSGKHNSESDRGIRTGI